MRKTRLKIYTAFLFMALVLLCNMRTIAAVATERTFLAIKVLVVSIAGKLDIEAILVEPATGSFF
ncbi:hypothetical protein MHBO_004325 [Bonamia ostreae]